MKSQNSTERAEELAVKRELISDTGRVRGEGRNPLE